MNFYILFMSSTIEFVNHLYVKFVFKLLSKICCKATFQEPFGH